MKITRLEKILLALMLAGSLTFVGIARAEEQTYTIYTATKKDSSDNELYTVTVTVTADDSQTTTYTLIDEKGVTHTYYTNPTVSSPTVTVTSADNSNLLDLSSLNLTYDSPNATTGTETTQKKYYAWVWTLDTDTETGEELTTGKYVFTEVSSDGYILDATTGQATEQQATVNVTVSYVPLGDESDYKNGYINDSKDNSSTNITADFVGDTSHGSSSGSGIDHGGAIDNVASSSDASLGTITGNFIGNYEVPSVSGFEYGGAIANYGSGGTASIKSINGNFIGNYVYASGTYTTTDSDTGVETTHGYAAYGGAIYNAGKIGTFDTDGNSVSVDENGDPAFAINADFVSNYAESEFNAYGGAIYNSGKISDVKGNFIGNYATTGSGDYAQGGAIYTNGTIGDITANFIGNFVNSSSTYSYGGAIHNGGTITSLNGDFIGNYVKLTGSDDSNTHANGGAIENTGNGKIEKIKGNFICNYVEASGTSAASGGAISNEGTIGDIEGDFIGNYTKMIYEGSTPSNRVAHGGAISNSGTVNSISGDFISNSAISTGNHAAGGAIYNSGTIGTANDASVIGITGNFIDNHAYGSDGSDAYAYGGAIYNSGSSSAIYGIKGDFIGNSVEAKLQVFGGAIYNTGTISLIEGDFIENSAESTSRQAYGGAINNTGGTIDNIVSNFIGNYAETKSTNTTGSNGSSYSAYGGAIFNSGGKIGSISGDFISNHVNSNARYAYGGAIYNVANSSGTDGTIESITGNFIGNYAISSSETSSGAVAWGGAIYNTGKISGSTSSDGSGTSTAAISANFIENKATSSANDSYGGAIYNNGTIGTLGENNSVAVDGISGSTFQGNTANRGGAIYNGTDKSTAESGDGIQDGVYTGIIASITNSSFVKNSATAYGGAIYNYADGAIYNIAENYFGENEAEDGNGGAIENAEANSYIGTITGNTFYKNVVTKSDHGGGAIYSEGKIDDLTNNVFVENASGNFGGAIYNNGGAIGAGSTGGITGNYFSGNTSDRGGAIYNTKTRTLVTLADQSQIQILNLDSYGEIKSIENNMFVGNVGNNYAGAIYNYHSGSIGSISKNYFSGNEAHDGNGGAVENAEYDAEIGTMEGNAFVSNVAYGNGGAIYNQGTIGIQRGDESTGDTAGDAIKGSIFSQNTAANGGAIYNNCTTKGETMYVYASASDTPDGKTVGYLCEDGSLATSPTGQSSTGSSVILDSSENPYFVSIIPADGAGAIGKISGSYFGGNQAIGHITNATESGGKTTYTSSGDAKGGAIYNAGSVEVTNPDGSTETKTCSIDSITGSAFVGNSAVASQAYTSTDDSGNTVTENGDAQGGAIYNEGTIGEINAAAVEVSYSDSFKNSVTASTGGGFINNYAKSTVASAMGGAIYNSGSIGSITADVLSGNYAEGATSAAGGAIYNTGTIGTSDDSGNVTPGTISVGTICDNYAKASGESATANGGAIYNDDANTAINVTGSITGNYATATNGTAQGGAIYTTGDVNVTAENAATILIQNNYAQGSSGKDDNAIYMAKGEGSDSAGSVNFSMSGESKIFLYDNIQGDSSGYGVNISGDGVANVFYLLNDVTGSNLSVGAALTNPNSIQPLEDDPVDDSGDSETVTGNLTLSTINGEAHVYNVNSFTVAGDFNMEADVDLKNEEMDRFATSSEEEVEHSGTLNVSALNIYSDTTKDSVAVYFAEEGLMKNVTSSVSSAVGPIYEYDLTYLYKDDSGDVYDQNDEIYDGEDFDTSLLNSEGGYFVFGNTGRNNPAVMASPVAMMGTYGAMNMMFDYNFEHSDYFMKLPEEVRLAQLEQAKAKKSQKRIAESDATRPAYYNRNELTNRGAWFRTFATNESVSYRGRYTSRDKYYGGLVGFDSDLREHKNGWASVFTGYAGTMGIRQDYSGGKIKQHGGMIGVTESFYRKNFYTAWTIAAGTTKAHAHTMYGKDSSRNDTYGIAARFGWNIDMDYNGKFAIVPTFTASYTYVNPEDFTNAAGVKITGSGLRAVQLNPNVKFVWKMNDGWQPYLSVGEVWTVGQSLHMRTDGQKLLDELELRAYTEYGIGVQKRWADEKDAYVQVMGHSDGRDGILVNAGIRWNF